MSDLTEKLRIIANWDAKGNQKHKTDCVTWKAADLIEQQQSRICVLERELEIHKRHTTLVGELTEYMVKRGIGTLGSTCTTEIVRLYEEMEQRNNELVATVERLRDYIERGSPYNTNPPKCERTEILRATPKDNLIHMKREVYVDGYYDGFTDCHSHDFDSSAECEDMALHNADEKSAKRYPDKE